MRITSKGQITIPVRVREELGLLPGCEVNFRVESGKAVLEKARERPGRGIRLIEGMRGKATIGMTTDEILALTRGE